MSARKAKKLPSIRIHRTITNDLYLILNGTLAGGTIAFQAALQTLASEGAEFAKTPKGQRYQVLLSGTDLWKSERAGQLLTEVEAFFKTGHEDVRAAFNIASEYAQRVKWPSATRELRDAIERLGTLASESGRDSESLDTAAVLLGLVALAYKLAAPVPAKAEPPERNTVATHARPSEDLYVEGVDGRLLR
jgi:hypothetical protein